MITIFVLTSSQKVQDLQRLSPFDIVCGMEVEIEVEFEMEFKVRANGTFCPLAKAW